MAKTKVRSKRKVSGGRYQDYRKKKSFDVLNNPIHTKIDERSVKTVRAKGGHLKQKLMFADVINVYDSKSKKFSKIKITGIVDNPANKNFIKRGIMTKGCIVKTEKGNVRITSRPGQVGSLDGILVQ